MKQVSAGIIICNDRILIARRSHNKSNAALWEFPGGKQEPGETMPECLRREISEELHLDIEVGSFFMNMNKGQSACMFITPIPKATTFASIATMTGWHGCCRKSWIIIIFRRRIFRLKTP